MFSPSPHTSMMQELKLGFSLCHLRARDDELSNCSILVVQWDLKTSPAIFSSFFA